MTLMASCNKPRDFDLKNISPLDFSEMSRYPHEILYHAHERFHKFSGNYEILVEENLDLFLEVIIELHIAQEDICMELLVASLHESAHEWFVKLEPNSITRYDMFEQKKSGKLGSMELIY